MKVELIDYMGSDLRVANAARVSFKKRKELFDEKDEGLIKFLARKNHWTPFGHCYVSFYIKAPLFVARQLGKHQVGLVWNEVSRRYVDDEPEFYTTDNWRKRADNIKQGSGENLPVYKNNFADARYKDLTDYCLKIYNNLLENGVAPEQARMVLPQSMYTEWYWSGSLMAFARVCQLRMKPDAQQETRSIAYAIDNIMHGLFPISWKELMNGVVLRG